MVFPEAFTDAGQRADRKTARAEGARTKLRTRPDEQSPESLGRPEGQIETQDKLQMTKPELIHLEKCFSCEIYDRLPYQAKLGKPIQSLLDKGMIEPMKRIFPGRFAVTCEGYQLTHLGRMTYGENC